MAYTQAWSNLIPLGSAAASTADDELRALRRDVQERMDTILGAGKWATDPVVTYPIAGIKQYLSIFSGQLVSGGAGVSSAVFNAANFQLTSSGAGSAKFMIPFSLPVGYTLTQAKLFGVTGGVAGMTVRLAVHRMASDGSSDTSFVVTGYTSGVLALDTFAFTEVVADGYYYVLEADMVYSALGNVALIYGAEIIYSKPNILS